MYRIQRPLRKVSPREFADRKEICKSCLHPNALYEFPTFSRRDVAKRKNLAGQEKKIENERKRRIRRKVERRKERGMLCVGEKSKSKMRRGEKEKRKERKRIFHSARERRRTREEKGGGGGEERQRVR